MRLISSFCALACVSALPLAAVAQTAAEPPAPETAPDIAGRTVLDVTASGTLTGLAADALGPDAALTVRLHGPVAFDVDTADFASLEIFADDPAVKLTVSDTAAYDRITAVSLPAAASGEPAAATFTAAAASAGIATLADGDTAPAVTPQNRVISINFGYGKNTNTHPVASGDSVGLVPVPSAAWFNAVQNKNNLSEGRTETVNTYWNGTETDTSLTDVTLWYKASTCWDYTDGVTDAFLKGYLDDGPTDEGKGYGAQINLSTIPFEMYDVYVYCATDTASQKFKPITIEYEDDSSIVYTANGAHPYGKAVAGNSDFGMTQQKTAILNTNTLLLRGLTEKTLKVRGGVGSGSTPRGGIAAIQVVESRSVSVKGEQTLSGTLAGSSSTTHAMFLLEADSALKVDSKNFNRLWIIGPETGTATLKIAADVDFSKIDLSEATNVNIEFVAPQEGGNTPLAVTGSLQASGDVTISTPVTLTVDSADVTPYWSVGGSLTIAEGSSLTLALPADTDVTAPAVLLSAASVVGQAGLQGPEGARLLNLGGTALVLAADDVLCAVASGETAWTDLTWTRADGTEAEIAGDSAVLLTLENGSSLDIAGAQTVASLNLAGASAAVAATLSGDGLSVSEALRVIRGNVTLPAGLAFDQTTSGDSDADDEPGDNPAFEIAEGASVTLSGSGKYIRKESVVGGGTLIKPIGIDRIGFYGAGQHSLDGITLRLLGGGVKFSLGTADPSMNNATVIFGDGTAGTDAALCQYGWLRLSGEVTFDAQSAMSHTTNSNARVAPISGTATRLTLTGPSAKRIALGESLAVTLRQGETTVTLAGNGNAVTVEPDAVAKIDGPGFAASGIFTGTGAVELTGTGTVQVNALADSFGGTLRVAEGSELTLPAAMLFASDASGTKPLLEIPAGTAVTVNGNGGTLVQRNAVRGLGEGAVLKVTDSVGYNLRSAGTDNVPILENVRLEVPKITASHDGDPWLRNATIAFTGGTSTWTAANWVKADGTVTVEVPEGRTVTFDTGRAFWREGEPKLVKTGAGTFAVKVQNIPIEVREGRLELTWDGANRPATTVAAGATLAMASADTMSLGNIIGNGTIEITGSTAVSGFGMEAGNFNGTLRIAEGVAKSGDWTIPCNVELNGTAGAGLTVGNGYTLSGTGTVTGTLTFEDGATLDASVGVLTVGGLIQPDTGTVTVKVAENAAVEDAVLRLSSGTADALAAAQFTVAERDTLRVAASGSDYVLAPRMPTGGEASVTVTKPADGSPLNWSDLQWTVGSDTYPSAAAGATNALTLALPEGVTVAVDETITAKSLTVTVVDGNGDEQVTDPAMLLLRGDDDLAGIAETLTVTAPAVLQVPCTGTAQQAETMDLAKVRGSGVLEISGVAGATCSAQGLSTEAGVAFGGTLRIAEGVTTSGDWTIPCNVELNGTVSGTLTVSTGKRFGGSGTVTGQLKLENGYILKCGASAAQVPLIGTEVGEGTRVFDTSVPVTGGRLWRDTAKEDFILRLAKIDDYDPAFIADSSGYVVDSFTENDVSSLRLAAAFELDLSDLRDPGKTSGTYAWNVADSWIAPEGGNSVPGENDVVRIMVPASRNVTVVIPPDASVAVRAIQVIGMTGEAEGWTTGTLRWVEGKLAEGSETVTPSATLSSTLTTQEIRMAGPMEITQECNVSVKSEAGWTYEARIGSGAAASTVHVKAGKFEADSLIMDNTTFIVGGEENTAASVICDFLYLQTQSGGSGSLTVGQGGSFTPSYIQGISSQDSLKLAGGTFTVPAGGMKLSEQIEVSADSTLHFAGTELAKAILSFVDGAPRTGFSGSGTLTLTGTGTLNASNATEGSAYTGHLQFDDENQVVCNIGQRRPAIGGAPYRIEVVRKASGEESEVRIPLYGVDTFVMPPLSNADATAGVAVSDWVGTVAEIVKTETSAELVLTPLGYPQLEGGAVPGISGEAAMVLRKLANSGNSNFTVRQTTVTGDSMDFFDAEGVNAALLLFTNVAKKETDGSVTVAYAFGISDITVEGDDIIVTAKVLGPKGAATAADFAKAVSVDLYRDGVQSTAEPSAGTEAGTQVFKLEGALSTLKADSAATFTVKATSGVEQTPDESVPDEGTDSE